MDRIKLKKKVLGRNDILAAKNRELFLAKGISVLNLVSSPGSGKTALLEATLGVLSREFRIAVIEGDIRTENDARRIAKTGVPVQQIMTGGACHLEASMISNTLGRFDLEETDLLIIENVGNLVCPAAFDLGEGARIVLVSVTEGDDKPLKYPAMFYGADVMVINKMDLLPHTDFSVDEVVKNAKSLNPDIQILMTSCRTGEGFDLWMDWIRGFCIRSGRGVEE